jgi:DNA-binding CsgD family transcriptional regulator
VQQVAAINFRILINAATRVGISQERLLGGLPAQADIVQGGRSRFPWSDYVAVLEQLALLLGGYPALRDLSVDFADFAPEGSALLRPFASPIRVYHFIYRTVAPLLYPMITRSCTDAGQGRLRISHSIDAGHEECTAFGWAACGALRSLPRFIGLEPAQVEALELGPRRSSFLVTPPASRSALAWSKSLLPAFVVQRRAFREVAGEHELALTHSMLQELLDQVEAQNAQLAAQLASHQLVERALQQVLTTACNAAFVVSPAGTQGANELGRLTLAQEGLPLEQALRRAVEEPAASGDFELSPLGEPGHFLVLRRGIGAETERRIHLAVARWQLTPRHQEVLRELLKGGGNLEIARTLGCSQRTVETHITAMLERAGVDSRLALLAAFWSEL